MPHEPAPSVLSGIARVIHRIEDALLAIILSAMIVLAFAQILMRNLFESGILWADPLLKVMVLWLGLLGALAATRERKHINIDVLSKLLPARGRHILRALTTLFAAAVSALIAFHATRFILLEIEDASIAPFGGIPAWMLEVIIPIAFGLIAMRYLIHSVEDILALIKKTPDPWA